MRNRYLKDNKFPSESELRVQKLEKVLEASKVIHSVEELDDLLNTVLAKSIESIGAERGTIYLADHNKNTFSSKVHTGDQKLSINLPLGTGIAGRVVKTGETINVKEAAADDRFFNEIDKITGFDTKNMLCMPLKNRHGKILGAFQLLNKKNAPHFLEEDEEFIEAFSIHAAIAIEKARLYEVEKQKTDLEKELFAAGEVQKKLFPSNIPQIEGYELAATNIPAKVTSGDLYEFLHLKDGKVLFSLGDVSGKGLPAAITMANLQSLIRAFPSFNPAPDYCVEQANKIIEKSTADGKFVTLFLGVLDPVNHTVTYTNAGHENPYHVSGKDIFRLSDGGLPLGIFEDVDYQKSSLHLQPGDLLVVFSDGIADTVNKEGDFFSEERFLQLILEYRHLGPNEIIKRICSKIKEFTENTPQFDDITLSIIKREDS